MKERDKKLINKNQLKKESSKRDIMYKDLVRLATFPAQNPSPIFELNLDGKVTYANRAALEYFPDLIEGRKIHPLIGDILKKKNLITGDDSGGILIETVIKDRVYEQYLWYSEDEKRIRSFVHDNTPRNLAEKETLWRLNTQKVLNKILRATLDNISLKRLLQMALDIILSLPWLSFENRGCIFAVEEDNRLVMIAQKGIEEDIKSIYRGVDSNKCLCWKAVKTGRLQFVSKFDENHEITFEGSKEHGHYCVPIVIMGKTVAVLNIFLKAGHKRNNREEEFLLTVSNLIGLIIKHKKDEETLKEREHMLSNAQRIAHMGTWNWDIVNNAIFWSDEIYRIFGVRKRNFGGSYENFLSLVHPEDVEYVKSAVDEAISNKKLYNIEHRIVRPDGKILMVHEKAAVKYDENGKPLKMIGYVRDITREKEAERIKDELINLKEALNKASILISEDLDFEEIVKKAINSSIEITGADYSAFVKIENGRVSGLFLSELQNKKINKKTIEKMARNLEKTLIKDFFKNSRSLKIYDITNHWEFGKPPEYHPDIGPLLVAPIVRKGKLIGLTLVGKKIGSKPFKELDGDIIKNLADHVAIAIQNAELFQRLKEFNEKLEKKVDEATKNLQDALKRAEAASMAKSSFLANMSHELRTPLNAIIGFTEILKEEYFGNLNEKQKEYLNDILESANHLLSLINDILDLSKIEAGKMGLVRESIYIAELLKNSLYMVKEKALKHGIDLKIEISDKLKDLEIMADRRKIKQVMFNLLSNAEKFTPDGGKITVKADIKDNNVLVTVEDTGIGIQEEFQEKIFEDFYQVQSNLSEKPKGTGLGLSIVKQIVEMHGGKVGVFSEGKGKGSRFYFTIPMQNKN